MNMEYDASGLSPEEIAALNGEENDDGADEELDNLADDDADTKAPSNETDEEEGDDGDDNAEDADGTAEVEVVSTKEDDDAEDATEEAAFVPKPHVNFVEDYDTKMDALKAEKLELRTKLTEGEITLDEYEEQKDEIVSQETKLIIQQNNAENERSRMESEDKQKWEWSQENFFEQEANKIYTGNDIRSVAFAAALNQEVIALATADNGKNAQRHAWLLQEADRRVRAALGAPVSQPQQKTQSRRPDLSVVPKTLGSLPAAEQNETGSTEFSYLDKLEGMELEAALAQLSKDPAKERRYLEG